MPFGVLTNSADENNNCCLKNDPKQNTEHKEFSWRSAGSVNPSAVLR